jgi:hypothetical protein
MYEIKPLEWVDEQIGMGWWSAAAIPKQVAYEVFLTGAGWNWRCTGIGRVSCDSLDDGKFACQAHWNARVRECLIDRSAGVAALVEAARDYLIEGRCSEADYARVKAAIAALEAK